MSTRHILWFFLAAVIGCAPVVTSPYPTSPVRRGEPVLNNSSEVIEIANQEAEPLLVEEGLGRIFAKTVFEGVVRTSYVSLTITDVLHPTREYQLIIGDRERQKNFPWEVQRVGQGYFFIELPEGEYRISSITIPVGTKKATEPMDVVFNVETGRAAYGGTIQVVGIRERFRLGGVPLVKPGFEYRLKIFDEMQQAVIEFKQRYPDFKGGVVKRLMQLEMTNNIGQSGDLSAQTPSLPQRTR